MCIELLSAIAISGRQFTNRSQTGRTFEFDKSAYSNWLADRLGLSQDNTKARISLCRKEYRWRAVGQLQFDRTCLFVCGRPHAQSGHDESWVLPQRLRFAAV